MSRADRLELHAGEIVRRLTEGNVDFVVIGGIAAILQGASRDTFDLDVSYATNPANLAALGEVLTSLGAQLKGVKEELPFIADARTLRQMEALTMLTELGELDVLAKPSGAPAYEQMRARADRYELDDITVLVASVEDLLAMKRSAGRPKDLADVAELEAIARLRRQAP